jgi:NO-binding membrane sensor protein with MHYT domain
MNDMTEMSAHNTAAAAQNAELGVNDLHYRGLEAAVQIGRGQANTAQLGLSSVASNAASKAMGSAQNSFNESASTQQGIGTAAGMGLRAYEQPSTK